MVDKVVDVNNKDIIWKNLDVSSPFPSRLVVYRASKDGAFETRGRFVIAWAMTIALILLWSLPVSFVGLLSNISQLCSKVSWLSWICKG
jgi:calcium permeable stress-gated cation channel